MRVYVAGSTRDIENVRAVQTIARYRGHEITFDWTGPEGEVRNDNPWDSAPEKGAQVSTREIKACKDADLIVLLFPPPPNNGLGCWIEMGAGLASESAVWIVGARRDSVFWQHPQVERLKDIAEVLVKLTAEYKGDYDG